MPQVLAEKLLVSLVLENEDNIRFFAEPREVNMARYSVYFFCDECSQVHPLGITIELNDGPPDRASIGDTYAGRELPSQVATLMGNKTPCPNTGRMTSQEDNKQVFLVPIG